MSHAHAVLDVGPALGTFGRVGAGEPLVPMGMVDRVVDEHARLANGLAPARACSRRPRRNRRRRSRPAARFSRSTSESSLPPAFLAIMPILHESRIRLPAGGVTIGLVSVSAAVAVAASVPAMPAEAMPVERKLRRVRSLCSFMDTSVLNPM